jgi:hypothetical protein
MTSTDIRETCNPCPFLAVRVCPHKVFTGAKCDYASLPVWARTNMLKSFAIASYRGHNVAEYWY